MIIIIVLLLILYVILYDYYVHHKRSGRLIDLIPGFPSIPIFGSAFLFKDSRENIWQMIRYFLDIKYPVTKVWLGPECTVMLRHPDDLQEILNSMKHTEKSRLYDILRPWLKDSLLLSKGDKWYTRRNLFTPAFHFTILQQFGDILIEESNYMTKSLKENEGTVIKDLVPFLSFHTLNAICETAMGISLRSFDDTFQKQYRKSIQDIGQFCIHRLLSPWLYSKLMFALSPTGRKQAKTLKILHGFTEQVIKERKLYHEHRENRHLESNASNISTETDDVEVIGIRKKRLALLDLLIVASRENHISDSDIREEIDIFMFGGHDTTAMAICFSLLLLAEHKDIQDHVRTEVNDVIKEDGKLTMASLKKLLYLERCLKEALRLYPVVPFISRILKEDIKCQSYTVPANTFVTIDMYGIHRDPHFWPNPDVFDPDRFLPDRQENRHPYCFLPFSAGPRNCIGQRFAMYEMKAMVASLVHKFYLEPQDYLRNLKFKLDIILCPAHPVRVKFVPIK